MSPLKNESETGMKNFPLVGRSAGRRSLHPSLLFSFSYALSIVFVLFAEIDQRQIRSEVDEVRYAVAL